MLKDLFKKTHAKVDTAIDTVVDDTKKVMTNANDLVDDSKDKIKIVTYVVIGGFALNMITNLVTLYCCSQVIKSVNKNDVLNDIAKLLKTQK